MESWKGRGGGQEVRRVIRGNSAQQHRRFLMDQSPLMAIPSLMSAKSIKVHTRQKEKVSLNSTKEPFQGLWVTISQIRVTVSSTWTVTQFLPCCLYPQDVEVKALGTGNHVAFQLQFKSYHSTDIYQFNKSSTQFGEDKFNATQRIYQSF